jgi:hypothetical protein
MTTLEDRSVTRRIGGALLALHGMIHTIGFLVLWRITEIGEFTYDTATPDAGTWPARFVGVGWIAAAALFVVAGVLLFRGRASWRTLALAGLVVSTPVVLVGIAEAPMGLVANAIVLLALVAPKLTTRYRHQAA